MRGENVASATAGDGSSAPGRGDLRRRSRWGLGATAALTLLVGLAWACDQRPHAGRASIRHFDPDQVADAELQMWRAYYTGASARLFGLLVNTLREQYNLTWVEALQPSLHFARAALRFSRMHGHYESVLPDLERGYQEVGEAGGEAFDPHEMAQAELAWWEARRDLKTNSPTMVGSQIARLYAAAYGVSADDVLESAVLRARAAWVRDEGSTTGNDAYWTEVEELLHQSYRVLHTEVAAAPSHAG